jgi:phenylalanyl-tRNA synthetase beta chain
LSKEQRVARVLRRALTQAGFHEAVTYSLTAPERANQLADGFASNHRIGLAMPMSEERSVLRTSLLPHLLEAVAYNRNRNTDDVALFEMGNIFLTNEEKLTQLPREQKMIAAVLTGAKTQSHWSSAQQQALTRRVDYFDLKGTLELMLSHVGIGNAQYVAAEHRGFHPGRTADIWITAASGARERLGWIGQLHPQTQTALELEDTYVFELDMVLLAQAAQLQADYTMLARYPASSRDIAVVVDAHIPAVALETTIIAAVRGLQSQGIVLESLNIFDIYTGEKLGQGKKSIAFALVYRHGERTLTDQEVNEAQAAVIQALAQQHGAQLRMS